MENLKENIKKIEELKKENYNLKQKNDALIDKSTELYHKNYNEFKNNDDIIKQNKQKMQLNDLKITIVKNNLHYLFKQDFEALKEKMLNYYENKNIGEKTKEKIQNEIKEHFKNNYNVNIACYLSISKTDYEYSMIISFDFLNEQGYKDYNIFQYNEEFIIKFEKHKFNDYKLNISYSCNIIDYVELKELNKKANELLKEYSKTIDKIEKLRLQQKELYHNFDDKLQGLLFNKLNIDTTLRIY